MLFNSAEFIFFFLPITVFVFFALDTRIGFRSAIGWLVLASLVFYGWWNPIYLLLILLSMLCNYGVGLALDNRRVLRSPVPPKLLLVLGTTFNLGLLGYITYANFFVASVHHAAGTDWQLAPIVLPLAISLFTFQQIAYLIDTYRGKTEEHDFLRYALFLVFFPQLIAGLIVRYSEMLPQFARRSTYRLRYENLAVGFTIFIIGLFKKVFIADNLALTATPVFAANIGTILYFNSYRPQKLQ